MRIEVLQNKLCAAVFWILAAVFFWYTAANCFAADSVCVPRTCGYPTAACNTIPDNCGGVLNCGTCAVNQKCINNQCVAGCVNECPPNSPPQCFGNAYRYCRETNNDGCLEWDSPVSCPLGWYCRDGMCISSVALPSGAKPMSTADTSAHLPPVISQLSQLGTVATNRITITCATDKAAACRFDTKDIAYGSMANSMTSDEDGISHFGRVTLSKEGNYALYIRCADEFGAKNTKSAKITLVYSAVAAAENGPAILNIGPAGSIYEKDVALTVTTDGAANCRYSVADLGYAAMEGYFITGNNLFHRALIGLKNYGDYQYYVRCRDKSGKINADAAKISFNYAPRPAEDEVSASENASSTFAVDEAAASAPEILCESYASESPDYVCDNAKNCVCDRDCPESPYPNADPDCANISIEPPASSAPVAAEKEPVKEPPQTESEGFSVAPVAVAVAGLLVAAIVFVGAIMKRRDEKEIEG